MKKTFLSIILVSSSFYSYSQNSQSIIDSLKQVISKKPADSLKVKVYSDLCWYYRDVSIDSAFSYGNKALKLSQKTKNRSGEAQAYNDLGILYYDSSNFKKAINYYKKTLVYRESINDSVGLASIYNKLGIAYQRIFKMDSALVFATNALKIYEAQKHIKYAALIRNNIANIYQDLKQYKKALHAHLEVAETYKKINDYEGLTFSYTNIGNAYLFLNDTVQAFDYYNKGRKLAEKHVFKREMSTLYNNMSSVLKGQKKYNEAIELCNKSLGLRMELHDDYGVSSAAINLGGLYLSKGDIHMVEQKLRLGLNISKKIDAKELELNAYGSLLSYYAHKKNTDSIIHYQNLYNNIQDFMFNGRMTKEIAEVQEKYNTTEREKEILAQRANIAEKELYINQKNTQIIGLVILAIVVAILGYLLFNQQKLKNNQLKKEGELKEALIKIESQNKLQEQRLNISRDLHDNIGAQLTFIISSIDNLQYGFKITNQKLTNKLSSISTFTKETIYELRDTIWAMNKSDISLEDLQVRISNFVDKVNSISKETKFEFNIDPLVSNEMTFTSVKGMNIYRMVQEAINNALKYAHAKTIKVEFKNEKGKLHISINDDGQGFDLKTIQPGNGLNNMKKRAQELGTTLNILSKINEGTSIEFEV